MKTLRAYFSASIVNAPSNLRIARELRRAGIESLLPQDITPNHLGHEEYPRSVYARCLQMMEDADFGLLVLDSYGLDSAWEAGWFQGRGKPMVGWVDVGLRFTQDWMVKHGLDAVLVREPMIASYFEQYPHLAGARAFVASGPEEIAVGVKYAIENCRLRRST